MSEDKVYEVIESVAARRTTMPKTTRRDDNFTRTDVVNAFQRAFTMIGGVQRLALWANANPDKFYPLYARMMPSTSIQFGVAARQIIEHAIPPSPLDDHPIPNVFSELDPTPVPREAEE